MFQRFDIHSRILMRSGIVFYGARDKLLGRDVWLWRLYEFHEAQPPPAELLAQEKAPLRSLRHPGIVVLNDVEADPDGVVAMLEPAAGEPLDEVISGGPMRSEDFVPLAEAVLAAFAHAAGTGIVHGAIEAGMIFLDRGQSGEAAVKILGFGLSRLMVRLHGGSFGGCEAEDLRQLGLIFHGLLAGEPAADPPPAIQEKAPAVSHPLAAWLTRFFATENQERHATAASALESLRAASAPPPPEPVMMPPAPWPAGYDPNMPMHPPGWMPQPAMWQPMPMPWPPHDPHAMPPAMWPQPMMHPWPQPMPMMQPQAPAPVDPPPAAAPPAKPGGPISKPLAAPSASQPSGPLPSSPKSGALRTAKPSDKKPPPKTSAKKWTGPALALAATCITLWFMRGFLSPLFRSETWQGMFGNIEIRIGDGKPNPPEAKAAAAKSAAPPAAASAPAAATAQPAAPPPAAAARPKAAAKKSTAPKGPVFSRNFDDAYRKRRTPEFKPAGAKITVIDAPATWPGGGKVAQAAATAKHASLRAALPKDPRLALKPGQGLRLQFDIHFTAPLPPMERGFRFGIFSGNNTGYFCSVPAGAAGEMKLMANRGRDPDLAGGKDAVEIPSPAKASHPGLAAEKVLRCSLTLQPQADGSIKLAAAAGEASCSATADPKIHPIELDFTSGLLVLRNTDQQASYLFDEVLLEAVK